MMSRARTLRVGGPVATGSGPVRYLLGCGRSHLTFGLMPK